MPGLAQIFDEAALVDEKGAPARPHVRAVERHNDLGRDRSRRGEEIGFVRAGAMLEDEGGVDDGGEKQGLFLILRITGPSARNLAEIEDAAGRCAVK
jgi:hypothetical protein